MKDRLKRWEKIKIIIRMICVDHPNDGKGEWGGENRARAGKTMKKIQTKKIIIRKKRELGRREQSDRRKGRVATAAAVMARWLMVIVVLVVIKKLICTSKNIWLRNICTQQIVKICFVPWWKKKYYHLSVNGTTTVAIHTKTSLDWWNCSFNY